MSFDKLKSSLKLVGKTILTANYVLDKVPYKKLEKTPYEL